MGTSDTPHKSTSAFLAQAAIAFGVSFIAAAAGMAEHDPFKP
jgi:hypothetical protein